MFLSCGQIRLALMILMFGVILAMAFTESLAETMDTQGIAKSRMTRSLRSLFENTFLKGARRAIMIWRGERAQGILLADSVEYRRDTISTWYVKQGGIERARKDFSRLVKQEVRYIGGGKFDGFIQTGKVGDKVVFFYPRYSNEIVNPVISMTGLSQEKLTLMVVYAR